MKRMIRYHQMYASDGARFSCCSTKYTILPGLYADSAGVDELRAKARELGVKTRGVADVSESRDHVKVTEAIKLVGKVPVQHRSDTADEYLGFVKLVECAALPPTESVNNASSKGALYDILNEGNAYKLGIEDAGEAQNEEYWLIMSDWGFYHQIPLLGYSLEKLLKAEKVDDTYFYDSVFRCGQCGAYDSTDDGHHYNYRELNCDLYGINCGCYHEAAIEHIDDYANEPRKAVEQTVIEELQKQKRVEFIERFVGGMTDAGRSHYYAGEYVRVGDPKQILADLLKKHPKGQFIFCHDESGQFQTYFSVYRLDGPKKRAKLKLVKQKGA